MGKKKARKVYMKPRGRIEAFMWVIGSTFSYFDLKASHESSSAF